MPTTETPLAEIPTESTIRDPGPPPPVPAQLRWHRVALQLEGATFDVLAWAAYPLPVAQYIEELLESEAHEIIFSRRAERRAARPDRTPHVFRLRRY